MSAAGTVHVVVPAGIEDPARPSGGNTYDRGLCRGLTARGWSVAQHAVAGDWPWADETSRARLSAVLDRIPSASPVLIDGLVASAVPEVLVPAASRVRLIVLMHLPLGVPPAPAGALDQERAVLAATAAVITTSAWTRHWLLAAYGLDPGRVHVAHPGVEVTESAPGSVHGGNLLCVGAVTPGKGQDLLLAALRRVGDLPWTCRCVGDLTRAPEFVAGLRDDIAAAGLTDRFLLTGPRATQELDGAYARADVLVHASRGETYGMVVTEALAHGLPVLAADVGGLAEALGTAPDGRRPGMLVPAEDPAALAHAVRRWLTDPTLRHHLRGAARRRRTELTGWPETADRVTRVLAEVAA